MWDLNLGVQACQKNFKLFRHRNTYASIYLVYNFFNLYKHHRRFQKTDIDENKPTVITSITVGFFSSLLFFETDSDVSMLKHMYFYVEMI